MIYLFMIMHLLIIALFLGFLAVPKRAKNVCPKCGAKVSLQEAQVLEYNAPRGDHIAPCPHCDKLMHLYD